MTSFNDLVDRCAITMNDTSHATWTRDKLTTWLNDAIRDYSQHFPRILTQTITCGTADHDYDLQSDFLGVISVEYPAGEDPKIYLSRLDKTHVDFWTGSSWYDIVPRNDDQDASEILVSADTVNTEEIDVLYNAHHTLSSNPILPTENCTVPPIHQHLLVKYTQWQAASFLVVAEMTTPTSNSSLLMAQLSQNTRRYEAGYHTALQQTIYAADGESHVIGSWTPADYSIDNSLGRIY